MFAISVEESEEKALPPPCSIKSFSGQVVCLPAVALAPNLSGNRQLLPPKRGAGGSIARNKFCHSFQGGTGAVERCAGRSPRETGGVLVDAVRQLGADSEYVEAEGYPPLKITGTRLHGGALTVSGSVSSQYITAILLIAPVIGGITLTIEGEIMSRPYIDMTLALMARYGVKAEWRENVIHVLAGEYTALDFTVEADWSAASYWWAMQAIVPQSRITLKGLEPQSLQGDSRIAELMSQMGVTGNWCGRYLDLRSNGGVGCCCSTFADLSGTPDIAQTLVVMLCLMGRPFRITGLRTLRIKETDRLEALRTELRKLGYVVKVEGDDAISWHFETTATEASPHICTYHDHRMAMAFAPAAIRFPGLIIDDAQVVSKSYPLFWEHLRQAGFKIEEV